MIRTPDGLPLLNLARVKRVVIVGGGTAGWFAALEMRHCFAPSVEVVLIESDQIGIIGAGEGSIPNFELALQRYGIDRPEFMHATQATYKLGVCFDGWRGVANDRYYHLFSTSREHVSLQDWQEGGFYPLSSKLMGEGFALDQFPGVRDLVNRNAGQSEVAEHFLCHPKDVFAYHFDARKLAAFLSRTAQEKGVQRVETIVRNAVCDGAGNVVQLNTDGGPIDGDFFIDASGFRRVLAEKTLGIGWQSFQKQLILDSALPFFMPLKGVDPPLTTQSTAMKHGWMWTIPTQGRLGCGYVFSSSHASEAEILQELAAHWGCEVEPVNRLKFSPGRLDRCLQNNVLAVGLASGFVEPLEATSIAQTLYQLAFFGSLMLHNRRVLPGQVVSRFNADVVSGWDGILDFLVMHYDTRRADTPFWRDASQAPRPDSYLALKEVFRFRTPTDTDLIPYQMGGVGIFGVPSWECVGSAMGLIPPQVCEQQLASLDPLSQARLSAFMRSLGA